MYSDPSPSPAMIYPEKNTKILKKMCGIRFWPRESHTKSQTHKQHVQCPHIKGERISKLLHILRECLVREWESFLCQKPGVTCSLELVGGTQPFEHSELSPVRLISYTDRKYGESKFLFFWLSNFVAVIGNKYNTIQQKTKFLIILNNRRLKHFLRNVLL